MGCLGNHPATTEMSMPEGKNNCINMESFLPASEGKTWQKLQKNGDCRDSCMQSVMQ